MIKDVVIHNGLLRIATGTFVCMVGHTYKASLMTQAQRPRHWPETAASEIACYGFSLSATLLTVNRFADARGCVTLQYLHDHGVNVSPSALLIACYIHDNAGRGVYGTGDTWITRILI
jgi:hypothetical protein